MIYSGWRLVKRRYAESAFSGQGCDFVSGRWQTEGNRLIYASESLSTALLEQLAHGQDFLSIMNHFVAFSFHIDVPKASEWTVFELEQKSPMWRSPVPLSFTQKMGDDWISKKESAILMVPSAVVPVDGNILLNPNHRDFQNLEISGPFEVPVDARLLTK